MLPSICGFGPMGGFLSTCSLLTCSCGLAGGVGVLFSCILSLTVDELSTCNLTKLGLATGALLYYILGLLSADSLLSLGLSTCHL